MSRQHLPTRPTSWVAGLLAFACLGLLMGGCGAKSTNAPLVSSGDPTFNHAFLTTNSSFDFQFTKVGTWSYHCNNHSGMTGTVVVDPNSTNDLPTVQVGAGGNQYSPATVTIKLNGSVHWTNGLTTNHTVTRP